MPYKINHIIALRECKLIAFDEAFFSTVARTQALLTFLDEAIINNEFAKSKFFQNYDTTFLDHIKFIKNIVYCGDQCHLSISVERV